MTDENRKIAETVEQRTEAFAREWNQRPGVRRVIEGADHLVATPAAVEALDQEVEKIIATPDAEIPDGWRADAALTEALGVSLIYALQSTNADNDLTRDQLLMGQLHCHIRLLKIEHLAQLDAVVAAERERCAKVAEDWVLSERPEWVFPAHRIAAAIREGK